MNDELVRRGDVLNILKGTEYEEVVNALPAAKPYMFSCGSLDIYIVWVVKCI